MEHGLRRVLWAFATLIAGVFAAASTAVAQPANTALDRYLEGLSSWQADFSQSLLDARGKRRELQSGRLIIQRPGKFRWEVSSTAERRSSDPEQVMVADGRNLWFYDRDLEQVTVKPLGTALTATPALLLTGAAPVRETFEVLEREARDGLVWVAVVPRSSDAEFREARLGFASGDLRRMELDDKLGQRTTLVFSGSRRNAPVAADAFKFQVPAGADVIGTAVP